MCAMICEMCGKEVPVTKPMMVEGTKLNLCQNCAKFGDEYKQTNSPSGSSAAPVSKTVIDERLQRRERRMQTKDIYSTTTRELIDDYGPTIRKARESKGMDLDEFAKSIFERRSILARIEANELVPDDKMIAKLEKALNIILKEDVQSGGAVGKGNQKSDGMTLSNFIKKE
ncbi:transcription factor [Candidatus Methanoplasma termitum]|uniref:Transcription factor n=1 Tax=Candidatus Methanoplasma termitum TaxID=1577791 RepID=A0A0A7LDN9_9ARCH|nr:multiprotein bridging factor aMBF1 [Candidatus Methanoplasma termitum]AIZ57184.1 transcription factor [Candidatus Methanoplasma termitum]MCL2333303.1 multiprotein bridging factor aMBF1 [Candidatus Methanoplasma sp.]